MPAVSPPSGTGGCRRPRGTATTSWSAGGRTRSGWKSRRAARGPAAARQAAPGGIAAAPEAGRPGGAGEQVEVRGFLVRGGTAGAVEDGQPRPDGPAEPQAARDVTPGQITAGGHADTLVRVEA